MRRSAFGCSHRRWRPAAATAFSLTAGAERLSLAGAWPRWKSRLRPDAATLGSGQPDPGAAVPGAAVAGAGGGAAPPAREGEGTQQAVQYIDLDSRLGRLEGRSPGTTRGRASADNGQFRDIQLGAPGATCGQHADAAAAAAPADGFRHCRVACPGGHACAGPRHLAPPPLRPRRVSIRGVRRRSTTTPSGHFKDRYAESARRFQKFIDTYPAEI